MTTTASSSPSTKPATSSTSTVRPSGTPSHKDVPEYFSTSQPPGNTPPPKSSTEHPPPSPEPASLPVPSSKTSRRTARRRVFSQVRTLPRRRPTGQLHDPHRRSWTCQYVDCVIIGRHTDSESTIIQMIGRGLRKHPRQEGLPSPRLHRPSRYGRHHPLLAPRRSQVLKATNQRGKSS